MKAVAYVFPGQGAQYQGMGKDFYDSFAQSRALFNRASELLGFDMAKLCFEDNDKLNQTEYTQAAMLTVCAAILAQIKGTNLSPTVCAGLSLGEYTALYATGAFTFDDALLLLRKRGILMQNTLPEGTGGMAAILGLDAQIIDDVCRDVSADTSGTVSVANYNCPGQIVITGESKALSLASERCLAAGAKRAVPLKVSGPFHSPLLRPAANELSAILRDITIINPRVPCISNVTAKAVNAPDEIKTLLGAQIYSPVRWMQSVSHMLHSGIDTFVEIGPGKTLSTFIKKIDSSAVVINIEKISDLNKLSEAGLC